MQVAAAAQSLLSWGDMFPRTSLSELSIYKAQAAGSRARKPEAIQERWLMVVSVLQGGYVRHLLRTQNMTISGTQSCSPRRLTTGVKIVSSQPVLLLVKVRVFTLIILSR